jgi:hypothetical protein
MRTRPLSIAVSLIIVAAAFVAPAPVGATPASNYGSTASCRYQVTAEDKLGWTAALLKKIAVKPPTVYAKSGTQKVGWRFIVRRSLQGENGPWTVTYRSHIQQRLATTSTPADFDAMRVGVNVPTNAYHEYVGVYKVMLKIFWYGANGSVASKVSYLFPEYWMYVDGVFEGSDDPVCAGEANRFHE